MSLFISEIFQIEDFIWLRSKPFEEIVLASTEGIRTVKRRLFVVDGRYIEFKVEVLFGKFSSDA